MAMTSFEKRLLEELKGIRKELHYMNKNQLLSDVNQDQEIISQMKERGLDKIGGEISEKICSQDIE